MDEKVFTGLLLPGFVPLKPSRLQLCSSSLAMVLNTSNKLASATHKMHPPAVAGHSVTCFVPIAQLILGIATVCINPTQFAFVTGLTSCG